MDGMLESMTASQLAEWQVWCRLEADRVNDEIENPKDIKPGAFRPVEEMVTTMREAK